MGDVINLNKFRKARARAERAASAEKNRRQQGRGTADKSRESAERAKRDRELDGKRLELDD